MYIYYKIYKLEGTLQFFNPNPGLVQGAPLHIPFSKHNTVVKKQEQEQEQYKTISKTMFTHICKPRHTHVHTLL